MIGIIYTIRRTFQVLFSDRLFRIRECGKGGDASFLSPRSLSDRVQWARDVSLGVGHAARGLAEDDCALVPRVT